MWVLKSYALTICRHISEHLLQKIAQVVGRDSAVMAADVQHLYTALCEDDCLYFFFKRMNSKQPHHRTAKPC